MILLDCFARHRGADFIFNLILQCDSFGTMGHFLILWCLLHLCKLHVLNRSQPLVPAIESADFDGGMLFVLRLVFRTATRAAFHGMHSWQQSNGGHVQHKYLCAIALRSSNPCQAPSWIDMSEHVSSCDSTFL